MSVRGEPITETLATHFRVISAMILREARVKYGRSQAGYLWAIVEPVFFIIILSVLFSSFRSRAPFGESFGIFFATGVLPFQLYRSMTQYVGQSFDANRALFNYPLVKPIDAAFARGILETSTSIVVIVLVLGTQILALGAALPYDMLKMFIAFLLMAMLAFGTGLTNAVVRRFFPSWANLFNVILGPMFFLSGIFYTLDSIPTFYREILAWNPVIHGVEGFRIGYFANYRSQELSLQYLFWWGFTMLFIGMITERITRRAEP